MNPLQRLLARNRPLNDIFYNARDGGWPGPNSRVAKCHLESRPCPG